MAVQQQQKEFDYNDLLEKIFNMSDKPSYPWHTRKKEQEDTELLKMINRKDPIFYFKNNVLTIELAGLCLDDMITEIQGDIMVVKHINHQLDNFFVKIQIPDKTEDIEIDMVNGLYTATFSIKENADITINYKR